MHVTLLGSGDAVGVPAPLCGCRYCEGSPRRRRPALLVRTERATVVLDAGPEVAEQLRLAGVTDVDGFFLTHHHFDHVGGLHDLAHAAMGFDEHVGIEGGYLPPGAYAEDERPDDPEFNVYLTETARDHVRYSTPHLADSLDPVAVTHGDPVGVRNLRVVPFPVRHAGPAFDTLGFAVSHGERTVVYAPDVRAFVDGTEYADADVLFVEGAALFRTFGHGGETVLRSALTDAGARRTVLVNLDEHLQRMTTEELRAVAAQDDYELGSDFAEYRP